jgi:hypothetical protein
MKEELLLKDKLEEFWLGNLNESPFIILSNNFHSLHAIKSLSKNLAIQQKQNDDHVNGDYYIPHLTPIVAGLGSVAFTLGCDYKESKDSQWDPYPLSLFKQPEDVKDVKNETSVENSWVGKSLAMTINYFNRQTKLPIRLDSIPSPLITASYICGYENMLMAMKLVPDNLHSLLKQITTKTVEYIDYQINLTNRLFSLSHMPYYIPLHIGLRISDDVISVLSPELYQEFGVPYINYLSKKYGGLVIHSCGSVIHNLGIISNIDGLKGIEINVGENNPKRVLEFIDTDKFRLILLCNFWAGYHQKRPTPHEFVDYLYQNFKKGTFLFSVDLKEDRSKLEVEDLIHYIKSK